MLEEKNIPYLMLIVNHSSCDTHGYECTHVNEESGYNWLRVEHN